MDGLKEKWKSSISTVKAVIKFTITTKEFSHSTKNKVERSIDEQKREIDGCVA